MGFVTGDAVADAHILSERKLRNGASIAAGKVYILSSTEIVTYFDPAHI